MTDTQKIKSALPMEKLLEHYEAKKTSTNQYWCIKHENGGSDAGHKMPSQVVHPDSQTTTCKSRSCFEGDDVLGVIAKMEGLDIKNDYPKVLEIAARIAGVTIEKAQRARPAFPLAGATPLTEEHKIYLINNRKITEKTIQKADLMSMKDKVVFPQKLSGGIVGYKAKTIFTKEQQKELKNQNPEWRSYFFHADKNDIWLLEPLVGKKIIYLVAGEFDLMTLYQEFEERGLNNRYGAFTMTTGETTGISDDLLSLFEKLDNEEFRILYDFDNTGLNAMPKRAQELLKTGKKVFIFNWKDEMRDGKAELKDINDYFIANGNLDIFVDADNFKEQVAGVEEIEIADFQLIHPSQEIRIDAAVFGFRALMKDNSTQNIFLISKDGKIEVSRSGKLFAGNVEYRIDIRKRLLEPVEERWRFQEIKEFAKNPIAPEEAVSSLSLFIKKYSELPEEDDYLLLAAWIAGTYFFRVFWAYPFFNLKAPKKSGKSQLLDLLYRLCFNAKKARATYAALVDTVDSLRGTYIIDQADSLNNPQKEDIREILTDSYKTEGGKRRMIDLGKGRGERQVIEAETYSPKAFASIKELHEDLRDRCLIIPMLRSKRNFPSPDEQSEDWRGIRGNLYKFALTRYKEAIDIYHKILEKYRNDPSMVGRLAELWIPLETILVLNRVARENIERCRKLFIKRYGFTEYTPTEQEEVIILAILSRFGEKETLEISPKEIADHIDVEISDEERKKLPQKIGWAIKKFNLVLNIPKRYGKGMVYEFDKNRVDKIYENYFQQEKLVGEPTPNYTEENSQDITKDVKGMF